MKPSVEYISSVLSSSGRFKPFKDYSYKSMGIPVYTLKESITSPEEEKEIAFSVLSDVYKDAYGIRPRGVFDYDKMSLQDIRDAIDHYHSLPSAYEDEYQQSYSEPEPETIKFDSPEEENYHNELGKIDALNQEYGDLGSDDEYDLMPKHAGMKHESVVIGEDWDNYKSVEEIQNKYLTKLMLAIGLSTSDDRLPQVSEIFKTALEDAKMLGQLDNSSKEPASEI